MSKFVVIFAFLSILSVSQAIKCHERVNETVTVIRECAAPTDHCVNASLITPNLHIILVGCAEGDICKTLVSNISNYEWTCSVCNTRDLCNSAEKFLQSSILAIFCLIIAFFGGKFKF